MGLPDQRAAHSDDPVLLLRGLLGKLHRQRARVLRGRDQLWVRALPKEEEEGAGDQEDKGAKRRCAAEGGGGGGPRSGRRAATGARGPVARHMRRLRVSCHLLLLLRRAQARGRGRRIRSHAARERGAAGHATASR